MVLGYQSERLPDFAGLDSIARPCIVWEAVPPARKPFCL